MINSEKTTIVTVRSFTVGWISANYVNHALCGAFWFKSFFCRSNSRAQAAAVWYIVAVFRELA